MFCHAAPAAKEPGQPGTLVLDLSQAFQAHGQDLALVTGMNSQGRPLSAALTIHLASHPTGNGWLLSSNFPELN